MIFSRRLLRKASLGGRKKRLPRLASRRSELITPSHFLCPISLDLMKDPVTLVSTGTTYDRENIERWLGSGNDTCPLTNQVLTTFDLVPNHKIRKMLQDWCVSYGVERIPTPRVPVTASEVSGIHAQLEAAAAHGDHALCMEVLRRVKGLANESPRDRRVLAESGLTRVLAVCFAAFSGSVDQSTDNNQETILINDSLFKELLSVLTWMLMVPVGEETASLLGSKTTSLRCMALILKGDDLTAKQNVITVLRKLFSFNQKYANNLTQVDEEVLGVLFEMVKLPNYPSPKKALLEVMHHMVSSSEETRGKMVKMGLGSVALETLVDAERGVAERALAVIDAICEGQNGKENICSNPLGVPLLVKKILKVSELGTELCVSILWKICKGMSDEDNNEKNQVIEAMEFGAFQKVLVVLQVGCGEETKEKATDLLKLMNGFKDRVQCFNTSSDFKYLKKSY